MDHPLVYLHNTVRNHDTQKLIKNNENYKIRFAKELGFFRDNKCIENILFAWYIKRLISKFNIPFFIRGSAGGSLILYILGFTTLDPIKHEILFERFMNDYRDTLGDIDFDVPRSYRDMIFKEVYSFFNRHNINIGRICTRVFYQKNSAIREVLRTVFKYHHTIPKEIFDDYTLMKKYFKEKCLAKPHEVHKEAEKLIGKLRYSSAHVGGLVLLKEDETYCKGITKKNVLPLIDLDRKDIDEQKRFKVDILSNSGLDIIKEVYPDVIDLNEKQFPYIPEVFEMIGRGDTIGIFYGESPLSRSTFKLYHQKFGIKSILDIAKCISMIRPMASTTKDNLSKDYYQKDENQLIFDDDWIIELSSLLEINYSQADKERRKLSKNDPETVTKLFKLVSLKRLKQLMNIQNYGFCKGHALNYAQLIYCQAYAKWDKPLEYHATVLNYLNVGRIYASWIYYLEALKHDIKIFAFRKGERYIFSKKKNLIYPKNGIQPRLFPLRIEEEIKAFGGITSLKYLSDLEGDVVCCRRWKGVTFNCVLEGLELVDKIEI